MQPTGCKMDIAHPALYRFTRTAAAESCGPYCGGISSCRIRISQKRAAIFRFPRRLGWASCRKKSPCSRSNSAFKFINGKRYVFASAINPGSTDESKKEPDISALQILLQPACHLRRLPHIEPNPPAAVKTTMNTRAIHQVVNFPRALFSIFIIAV